MSGEQASVRYGDSTLAYRVERSARRRTVSIAVHANGEVVLRAPVDAPAERLGAVVTQKAAWIVDRVRTRRASEAPLPRQFCAGETFFVDGGGALLSVTAAGEASVRLAGRKLMVSGVAAANVRAALVAWYRTYAAVKLPTRLAILCERAGIAVPSLTVRDQAKRWGSCDAGGLIRINWRIVQAPQRLQDYVLAHEVAHLSHRDHSRGFWAALGAMMPDYESRRAELARIGGRYTW